MNLTSKFALFVALLGVLLLPAQAFALDQWASSVLDFSSEYGASPGSWSAAQALGAPDTFSYADLTTAWAPSPANGSLEYISVGYDTPVYANSVLIRESYGAGSVYQIDVIDLSDTLHTVWSGADPSVPDVVPIDYVVPFTQTNFLVDGVKVYIDTDITGSWEEIDAIQLSGSLTAPEPSAFVLLALGLVGLLGARRLRIR